jgi:hypothetical protein
LFTFTRNHRVSAHLAGSVTGDSGRTEGAKKRKLFLSIATVAAAGFSGAVVAAPANASTTAGGGTDLQAGVTAAPYSEEEIRTLQQRGDFPGASSRITANRYALGHMYQNG